MASAAPRRPVVAPNATVDGDLATRLELVCARLPHDYTRQLLRDVVRLKLELGFDGEVRDYLTQKLGSDSNFIVPSRGRGD